MSMWGDGIDRAKVGDKVFLIYGGFSDRRDIGVVTAITGTTNPRVKIMVGNHARIFLQRNGRELGKGYSGPSVRLASDEAIATYQAARETAKKIREVVDFCGRPRNVEQLTAEELQFAHAIVAAHTAAKP